jgi:hypothetical protein
MEMILLRSSAQEERANSVSIICGFIDKNLLFHIYKEGTGNFSIDRHSLWHAIADRQRAPICVQFVGPL